MLKGDLGLYSLMKSRKTDQAPAEKTFNFGFGEKQPHDYESYKGKFAVIHAQQQSHIGKVITVNNDCVVMHVPDAVETEYGPRYNAGNRQLVIARESIMAIRELSSGAYKIAVDEQYHGPLASLCGAFVDIQEGQNSWLGRLVYVHHPVHRARLSPVLAPARNELGLLCSDVVRGPLEFTYSAPIVRLLTEEEVRGLVVAQRQQDTIRHKEAQLRDFELSRRVDELYTLTSAPNNGAISPQQGPQEKKTNPKKKKK